MKKTTYVTGIWGNGDDWFVSRIGDDLRFGVGKIEVRVHSNDEGGDDFLVVATVDGGDTTKEVRFTWVDLQWIKDITATHPINVRAVKGGYGNIVELAIEDNNRTIVFGEKEVLMYEEKNNRIRKVQAYLGTFYLD